MNKPIRAKAGESVTISHGTLEDNYHTIVHEIGPKEEMVVFAPMDPRQMLTYRIKDPVTVCFPRKDALYMFSARILERMRRGEASLLRLVQETQAERIQRRLYYRLNTYLEVAVRIQTEGNQEENWYKTHTMDISGGGMRIKTDYPFLEGSRLECLMQIGDQVLRIFGEVLTTGPILDENKFFYTRILFHDIPDTTKETVVQFVFNEQKRLHRKGLL